MHFHYYPPLRNTSRVLRNRQTVAENRIWKAVLRKRQCLGYRFQRQRVIGKYIVDFFCFELKLIIEIDGDIHDLPEVKNKDLVREEYLKNLGCSIIRFTNSEVLNNLVSVIKDLEISLQKFKNENQ